MVLRMLLLLLPLLPPDEQHSFLLLFALLALLAPHDLAPQTSPCRHSRQTPIQHCRLEPCDWPYALMKLSTSLHAGTSRSQKRHEFTSRQHVVFSFGVHHPSTSRPILVRSGLPARGAIGAFAGNSPMDEDGSARDGVFRCKVQACFLKFVGFRASEVPNKITLVGCCAKHPDSRRVRTSGHAAPLPWIQRFIAQCPIQASVLAQGTFFKHSHPRLGSCCS